VDESREDGVDAGREENGGGDDKEVLDDEVDEVVWVVLRRESAGDVADDFERETDGEGCEVPGAVAEELPDVDDGEDEEDDDAEEGEGERGCVSVDNDGRVVGTAGERPVGIDVAAAAGRDSGRRAAATCCWDAWGRSYKSSRLDTKLELSLSFEVTHRLRSSWA
jgi:hypothetical protein